MSDNSTTSPAAGYAACFVATVFFGSNFATVRNYDVGDGMFVQWCMGSAIFIVGLIVNAVRHFPKFYPLGMFGGFLWATGNLAALPIIQMMGMAIGILIWSSTNMLFGWASGRFGWFGLTPQIPNVIWLNYLGVVVATIGSVAFVFVKSSQPRRRSTNQYEPLPVGDADTDRLVGQSDPIGQLAPAALAVDGDSSGSSSADEETNVFTAMPMKARYLLGTILSLVAGAFFGLTFTPSIYIADNYPGASQNQLDYVFANFMGIYVACTVYFVIYAIATRSKPYIRSELVLPSFLCGLMWAVAQASWFVANQALSEAISFPIITRMPGVVASLWGVFYFREIRGRRNFYILTVAILVTLAGAIITGVSKLNL